MNEIQSGSEPSMVAGTTATVREAARAVRAPLSSCVRCAATRCEEAGSPIALDDFKGIVPVFLPEVFFVGRLEGWAVLESLIGSLQKRASIAAIGTLEEETETVLFTETYTFDDSHSDTSIRFDLLYAFVIVRLDRRDLVWINVTANPTAEWVERQITEAFPWDSAPRYMIRDRDRICGTVVTRRLRAMGIRDKPTAAASPLAEWLLRECVDHTIALDEMHLRRVLKSYADYYNPVS
jgi:hypothetical protein